MPKRPNTGSGVEDQGSIPMPEGPRQRPNRGTSQSRSPSLGQQSRPRAAKILPPMPRKLILYLAGFIGAQIILAVTYIYYVDTSLKVIYKEPTRKSRFVDYPQDYEPPCQIKAKEANSALKRTSTPECKRDLAEIACKGESLLLYAKNLPNLCPGVAEEVPHQSGVYLGCYRDDFDTRILPGSFSRFPDNSRERCMNFCFGSGFRFAGTQYGRECFCGNDPPPKLNLLDDEKCNKPCTGDKYKTCGGYLTMNVYETGFVPPSSVETEAKSDDPGPVRIVYLLTVNGRAVRQLKRLIKKLFDGRNYFYVHVDQRQDYMYREMKSLSEKFPDFIRISENRYSTIWGGASLLRMLTSCMHELLAMSDWKWDFVLNLSESDYPLKDSKKLVDFLSNHRDKNFVKSHGRDAHVFIKKQGLDQTFYECDTHMFRLGPRSLPEGITVDGGSDWVCLNRKFVSYVVSGDDELLRGLRVLFNFTLLPAESFFHTTLKNSKFCSTYVNNNLRMTNWKRHLGCKCQHKAIVDWCGCSPNDFLPDDWHKLNLTRKKDIFFGRKFEPVVNQAVLDMVDFQLLEDQSNQVEKSYWQNIYHHADLSPKPDPAVLTLGQILSESAISVVGLEFEKLLQVTSFFYDDSFQGIVLTFTARDTDDFFDGGEKLFETIVRVKNPESKLEFRDGEIAVGTDFDPKELLFRNVFSAIGPMSKPVVTFDFIDSLSDKNTSAKIIWRDPVGRVAYVNKIALLNNSAIRESAELKGVSQMRPGIWTITFIVEEKSDGSQITATKVPFLVTPLLSVTEELKNVDYLKRLHLGSETDFVEDFLSKGSFDKVNDENRENEDLFLAQAERNAEKVGQDLKDWILDLAGSFYTVESVCRGRDSSQMEENLDPKFLLLPRCYESEWSTQFPDLKSELEF